MYNFIIRARGCVCVCARTYIWTGAYIKNDRLRYVWMTETTAVDGGGGGGDGGDGVTVLAVVAGCGTEGMGRSGPWNKSIPNGRETDGWTDGKKAAWQPECHSAPADIVLRARTCFSSSSIPIRVLYCFIAPRCCAVFPPRFFAGLDAITPCLRAPVTLHKCCSNWNICLKKKEKQKTIV